MIVSRVTTSESNLGNRFRLNKRKMRAGASYTIARRSYPITQWIEGQPNIQNDSHYNRIANAPAQTLLTYSSSLLAKRPWRGRWRCRSGVTLCRPLRGLGSLSDPCPGANAPGFMLSRATRAFRIGSADALGVTFLLTPSQSRRIFRALQDSCRLWLYPFDSVS